MTPPDASPHLSYESPIPAERPVGILGGIALLAAGLGLVFLGGCFLMGVLYLYTTPFVNMPDPSNWPPQLQALPWILYVIAFGCFAAAMWMLRHGVRWLYNARR